MRSRRREVAISADPDAISALRDCDLACAGAVLRWGGVPCDLAPTRARGELFLDARLAAQPRDLLRLIYRDLNLSGDLPRLNFTLPWVIYRYLTLY